MKKNIAIQRAIALILAVEKRQPTAQHWTGVRTVTLAIGTKIYTLQIGEGCR